MKKQHLASLSNYIVAAALLILAVIYLVKPSFMPYHSQALSLRWEAVDAATQTLFLALMRVCGGGWLAASLSIALLQRQFFRSRAFWMPPVILVVGLASILSTLYATLLVYFSTPGVPPILGVFILIFLLLTGYLLNQACVRKSQFA